MLCSNIWCSVYFFLQKAPFFVFQESLFFLCVFKSFSIGIFCFAFLFFEKKRGKKFAKTHQKKKKSRGVGLQRCVMLHEPHNSQASKTL
eukprot:m.216239 g.216239  ORF g.216239 m.216239 type:complete len:89 (+) comp22212_c0_seq12:477-743(+)